MAKLRSLTVNFNAGSSKYLDDVDKVIAKTREFGQKGVSESRAVAAALKVTENGFRGNARGADMFLESVAGLGPALSSAFAVGVVGSIAFAGVLVEVTKKANEFFHGIREAPERIKTAFSSANAGLRLTNDELQVANDRLENDIAKLEGKHQNNLKLALDESVASADKLAQSLDKDLEAMHKLVEEDSRGWIQKTFGLEGEFGEEMKKFRREIQEITNLGVVNLRAAGTDPTKQQKAKDATRDELNARYDKETASVRARLDTVIYKPIQTDPTSPTRGHIIGGQESDPKMAELYKGVLSGLQYQKSFIGTTGQNDDLTKRKTADEIARANGAQERPLDKMIAELTAKVAEARVKLKAAGLDETSKMIAKAEAEAIAAIEHANIALAKQHVALLPMDPNKSAKGREALQLATTEQALNLEAALRDKVREVVDATQDQIKTQQMLNQTIGKGWEAQKKVNIEVELMKKFGSAKYETAAANPMSDEFAAISAARPQVTEAVGDTHTTQLDERLRQLKNEVDLENALTQAQILGTFAVEKAALAERLRQQALSKGGLDAKEEQAAWAKFYAERANKAGAEIAKIDQEIDAVKRLTEAEGQGAEAVRKAGLESKYAAMAKTPQGTPEAIDAERKKDSLARQAQLTQEALKTGMAYKNSVESIDLQLKALDQVEVTEENALAIEISRHKLENERLDQLVKESLEMGGARDGVRAFFLEMQKDAKDASKILYEALNSAVDRVSGNLAKMMTQKPPKGGWGQEWAKSFQDVGGSMAQSSIKSLMQKGLGKLGIGGKPDGSSGNPLWVRMAGMPAVAGAPGGGGFGGGAQGGGIFSMLGKLLHVGGGGGDANFGGTVGEGAASPLDWGGFMADGGPVSASSAYIVGENGPEILAGASGRVISNGDAARAFGGGGVTFTNHIDARGADLGAHNRIMRGIEMSSRAAAATAVQAMAERQKRTAR
jgi:hypothetical protein